MREPSTVWLLALQILWAATVHGEEKSYVGRVADGTVGLGFSMYDPACAFMCRNSASGFMLDCPDANHHGDHRRKRHDHSMMMPSPECYASNDPFLQTVAWCIHTHCPEDLPSSKIESYWDRNVVGNLEGQPSPKYSYEQALSRVEGAPTAVSDPMAVLNDTSLVDEWLYQAHWGANVGIQANMKTNNINTLVLIITCSFAPVLFSLIRFLPLPQPFTCRVYSTVIDPPAFGTKHALPVLLGLGIMPTRGQMLFIAYLWAINIILCAVDYTFLWPTLWYTEYRLLVIGSVANRTGMLSFGNLSLAVLFASRNNVLLWVTSWSRSTFVLLHRWLAVICVIQGVLHSILYFVLHAETSVVAQNAPLPYYYWGIIAMVFMIIILPLSVLPLRRRVYEIFLASHIIMVAFITVGCFLHIYFRYHWQWGYEIWTVLALALWAFDRFLARPLRLLTQGVRRAHITIIDEDYLRVDVPWVQARGQAYLYFPTLTWRIWENHPFSVVPVPAQTHDRNSSNISPAASDKAADMHDQKEGLAAETTLTGTATPIPPGIAFFIRRRGGLTDLLARKGTSEPIRVLVEASYGAEISLISSPQPHPTSQYPNVICIAGGVGITGILPILQDQLSSSYGTVQLFWGVRTWGLVEAVETLLHQNSMALHQSVNHQLATTWGKVQVKVSIGQRFNIGEILDAQVRQNAGEGTTVVVCGPAGMSDEVRLTVADMAKRGALLRFKDERFGY